MKKVFIICIILIIALNTTNMRVSAHSTLYECSTNTCTITSGNIYIAEISVAGEHDYYYFTPITSGNYVIETYGNLDTYMSRTIDFGIVITNDDGGEKRNANMGFYASANVTYIFNVRAFSSTTTGDYMIQVRHQDASIVTFDYGTGDIDTTPDSVAPISELRGLGYSTWDFQNTSEATLTSDDYTGLSRLNKEILFWSGHGNSGFVSVVNSSLTKTYLYSSELPYMGNVKLAVWATCYSSSDPTNGASIAEQSVLNGAKASIGWPSTTTVGSSRTFTNNLFIRLNDGYSVSESASYAASKIIWPWDNVKDYELFGTTTGTIYSAVNNKQNTISYVPLYLYSDPWIYMMSNEDIVSESSIIGNTDKSDLLLVKSNLNYYDGGELVYREFVYVNGVLTTNFIDRTLSGREVRNHNVSLDIKKIDFAKFKSFDHMKYIDIDAYKGYSFSVNSSHNAIINFEGNTLPIRIVYIDLYVNDFGDIFSIAKVFNVNTGEELNYYEISYID